METLFVLLLTTWSPDVPHAMVTVDETGLTGAKCTAAIVEYNKNNPTWSDGTPSCEIDTGDWEESSSHAYAIEHKDTTLILYPCPTEDSDNCVWDAKWRGDGEGTGNGTGQSFYVLEGQVFYVETLEP